MDVPPRMEKGDSGAEGEESQPVQGGRRKRGWFDWVGEGEGETGTQQASERRGVVKEGEG